MREERKEDGYGPRGSCLIYEMTVLPLDDYEPRDGGDFQSSQRAGACMAQWLASTYDMEMMSGDRVMVTMLV